MDVYVRAQINASSVCLPPPEPPVCARAGGRGCVCVAGHGLCFPVPGVYFGLCESLSLCDKVEAVGEISERGRCSNNVFQSVGQNSLVVYEIHKNMMDFNLYFSKVNFYCTVVALQSCVSAVQQSELVIHIFLDFFPFRSP